MPKNNQRIKNGGIWREWTISKLKKITVINNVQGGYQFGRGICPRESLARYCGNSSFNFPRTFRGNRSSILAPRILAIRNNSKSGTRRCWFSRLDTDSRLVSHPLNCSLTASSFCVQPFRPRSFRTCGPTTFSCETGFSMLASYQSHGICVEALPATKKENTCLLCAEASNRVLGYRQRI